MKLRGGSNPFYVLLLIVGVVFAITSCAYGVMAFRQARPDSKALGAEDHSLMAVMDRHGGAILGVEVLLLGLLTVAAIGTDSYWDKQRSQSMRDAQKSSASSVAQTESTTAESNSVEPTAKESTHEG